MKDKMERLLDKYNIEYRDSGPNVGRDCINIQCPTCDDTSFHRGINYKRMVSNCWRCKKRYNVYSLLADILNIDIEEIKEELGLIEVASDSILEEIINMLSPKIKEKKEIIKVENLVLPDTFFGIRTTGITERFWTYLNRRGFSYNKEYINKYFRGCLVGEDAFRIIIPIYMNGKVMTWTGRSIFKDEPLRYKTYPASMSVRKITDCLLDYDDINKGGDCLFICEGPLDAIKMNWYLPKWHHATCLFTKSISKAQTSLLVDIANKWNKIYIILDRGEDVTTQGLRDKLSFLGNVYCYFLTEAKDPGELTEEQINNIIKEII